MNRAGQDVHSALKAHELVWRRGEADLGTEQRDAVSVDKVRKRNYTSA
jgi:hypothetical protein